jgi:hypothetical protein
VERGPVVRPYNLHGGHGPYSGPDGSFYGGSEWGLDTGEEYGYVFQLVPPSAAGGLWTCTIIHGFAASDDGVGYPFALTLSRNPPPKLR